jgi:hypothetical protein
LNELIKTANRYQANNKWQACNSLCLDLRFSTQFYLETKTEILSFDIFLYSSKKLDLLTPEFNMVKEQFEKKVLNIKSVNDLSVLNQTSSLDRLMNLGNNKKLVDESVLYFEKYFDSLFDMLKRFASKSCFSINHTSFSDLNQYGYLTSLEADIETDSVTNAIPNSFLDLSDRPDDGSFKDSKWTH